MAALTARRGRELSDGVHDRAARGFDRAAEDYERGRPGYPAAAVDVLAAELGFGPGSTVVDLAAGTGKLTRLLIPTGARVVAVEPVPGMRAQLSLVVPGTEILAGTAEAIPMPDAGADAVLVAQAFHWFDTPAAAREIHRVLGPGGGLGVIWNVWDHSFAWVAQMQELIGAHRGDTPQRSTSRWREQLEATGLFTALADRQFANVVHGSLDDLLARNASISFIATLPESQRAEVLDGVRRVVADHPEAYVEGKLAMPYVTQVAWCHAVES
ncbi:MAG TPA: class I SAM-dependent methyltransferase [Solirubrobacteraceae bacterium]|nr:class I SAM-dependent methyltransferase [Solirubrobacteraceae bacterium]